MYNSLQNILFNGTWLDDRLSRILNWYSEKALKKISGCDRSKFKIYILKFLLSIDKKRKLETLIKLKIDRNILLGLIDFYLKEIDYIFTLHVNSLNDEAIDLYLIDNTNYTKDLYLIARDIRNYRDDYLKFKDLIIEKYTRLALIHAQKTYATVNYRVDLDDIVQIYLMHVNKAIDKYDSDKGSLTSYVQKWFMNAHSYILHHSRSNSNMDEFTEDTFNNYEAEELKLNNEDENYFIRKLAKLVDPKGYGRLALGIEEILN